jgi:hypothetical protein
VDTSRVVLSAVETTWAIQCFLVFSAAEGSQAPGVGYLGVVGAIGRRIRWSVVEAFEESKQSLCLGQPWSGTQILTSVIDQSRSFRRGVVRLGFELMGGEMWSFD